MELCRQSARSSASPKNQGNSDWVCLNCNNLNYSFRKHCNRCKMISREQNHQKYLEMQYYQAYYYNSPPQARPNPSSSSSSPSVSPFELSHIESPPASPPTGPLSSPDIDGPTLLSVVGEGEGCWLFLLQNAWEGLYGEKRQWQQEQSSTWEQSYSEQMEGVETRLDLTFI